MTSGSGQAWAKRKKINSLKKQRFSFNVRNWLNSLRNSKNVWVSKDLTKENSRLYMQNDKEDNYLIIFNKFLK
jgi:hypothetical protein